MALPDKDTVQTMDYGFEGVPAVLIPAKSTIDTSSMDYGLAGVPFIASPSALGAPVGQDGFVAFGCMS